MLSKGSPPQKRSRALFGNSLSSFRADKSCEWRWEKHEPTAVTPKKSTEDRAWNLLWEEEDVSFFTSRGRCYTVKTLHCVSCSLNMIKAVFSHKKDEIIVKYEKKKTHLKVSI